MESEEKIDEAYKEYVKRYAAKHEITEEEAENSAIVISYYKYLKEEI